MTTTVGDLIKSSMRKIGVLAAGESLPASEGDDALNVLRQMVDSWALETLLVPTVNVVIHPLSGSFSEYTIGKYAAPVPDPLPVNHIETTRPDRIVSAFIRDSAGSDYVVEPMSSSNFAIIGRKSNVSRPSRMYVREGWPSSTLIFDSVPFDGEALHLEVVQALSSILPVAGLTESVNLPPGYEKAIVYNLCLDLADEWGRDISAIVATQAVQAKRLIKRRNYSPLTLMSDRAITLSNTRSGTYDIEGGP